MGLLLTEVALLVAPAVALGASLAVAGVALITPYLPIGVPWIRGTGVNATVLALTALVGCLTVLATGLVPALAQSRPDLSRAGRRGTASDTPTPSATRLVNGLVVGQVALAVVLLVCTALLVRSAAQVARVDPGFVPDRLLSATIALPENKFDWDHNAVFSRDVVTAVTSLPGVVEAAVVQGVPMQAAGFNDRYEVEGAPAMPDQDRPLAGLRVISPGYFRTMQIPLVAGRSFTERDGVGNRGEVRTAIVSQRLARRFWPGEAAVGKRLRPIRYEPWVEVIGVVGDVRYAGLEAAPGVDVYYPAGLFPQAAITLLVRTERDLAGVVAGVRERVRSVDADAFLTDVLPMRDVIGRSQAPRRSSTLLLAMYGALAVTLVAAGVSSVVAQVAAYRRREVAIRSALGAGAARIAVAVMRPALRATLVGVVAGLVGAAAATRGLTAWMFGVAPTDPLIWTGAVVVVLLAGGIAAYLPARRVMRVDPMVVLRE